MKKSTMFVLAGGALLIFAARKSQAPSEVSNVESAFNAGFTGLRNAASGIANFVGIGALPPNAGGPGVQMAGGKPGKSSLNADSWSESFMNGQNAVNDGGFYDPIAGFGPV